MEFRSSAAWKRFYRDERGQDLIEYALVGALLGLAAVAAMKNIASSIVTVFTNVGTNLTSAT